MKRRLTRMGNMPELYSTAVERPKQDLLGFDVLYVDVRMLAKHLVHLNYTIKTVCHVACAYSYVFLHILHVCALHLQHLLTSQHPHHRPSTRAT